MLGYSLDFTQHWPCCKNQNVSVHFCSPAWKALFLCSNFLASSKKHFQSIQSLLNDAREIEKQWNGENVKENGRKVTRRVLAV